MAVITKIGGVATSGTSGVNNVFGSGGGGGTPDTTDAPSAIVIGQSSTYGPQSLAILAPSAGAYTKVTYKLTVEDAAGNIIIDDDDCLFDLSNSSAHLATWSDGLAGSLGTRTVRLKAQEFGDQYDSTELTVTYSKTDASFQYYRIYGTNSAGTFVSSHMGIRELELYSGTGNTGTKYPTETMTSNTSTSYEADIGHFFSATYAPFRAFDNNINGTQSWTLGNNTAANNWIEIKFLTGTTKYPTTGDIPTITSYRLKNYAGDSASYYSLYGSDTGAFSGEEEILFIVDATSSSDTIYSVG